MMLSWSSLVCLTLTVISLARAWHLYSMSTKDLHEANHDDPWYAPHNNTVQRPYTSQPASEVIWGDRAENLFYFVQVSDLHISKYQRKGHTIHFLHFLQSSLPVIQPEFVVVTGDLVDAKDASHTQSEQIPEEWKVYKTAVAESGWNSSWYDIRGNHDCFDTASWDASNNMYKKYGVSSSLITAGKGVYQWTVSKQYGNYSFVAMDACPKKGPARPFNFFGYLTTNTMDKLVDAVMSTPYNHTFMFGHYPTSTLVPGISSDGFTLRELSHHMSAYFCGHLHRLVLGLGDRLKSYDAQTDTLELEVSDMKDHGSYRIVAVDHDLVSFIDVDLPIHEIPIVDQDKLVPLHSNHTIIWPTPIHPPPAVLITNPKDGKYIIPTKEPLQRINKSTHIRFLIFTEYPQDEMTVKIWIDNHLHPQKAEYIGHLSPDSHLPLWISPWDPNDFNDLGSHTLRIEASTPSNVTGTLEITFRMDNVRVKMEGGVGEWIIGTSITLLLQHLALFALFAMLLCLLVSKICMECESTEKEDNLRRRILVRIHTIQLDDSRSVYETAERYALMWAHRFIQFPQEQPYVWHTCYGLLLCLLSVSWFKAQFVPSGATVDERYGHFYIWGLLFNTHEWIPLADTWAYATFELTFTVGVFILYFIWKSSDVQLMYCRASESGKRACRDGLMCDRSWFQLVVIIYWIYRFAGLLSLAFIYGGLGPTVVLNLLNVWLFLVLAFLFAGKNGIINKTKERQYDQVLLLDESSVLCSICGNEVDDDQFIEDVNTDSAEGSAYDIGERHVRDESDGSIQSHSTAQQSSRATLRRVNSRES